MRAATLIALALLGCWIPAAPARGCNYVLTAERLGPPATPEELAAEAKREALATRRAAALEATKKWRKGVDAPAELAQMLVSNVRPVPTLSVPCGGGTEELDYDLTPNTREAWLAGTRYAGRSDDFGRIFRDFDGVPIGPACNAEVRGRFAEHLRRRLTADELRTAYTFLAARRPPAGRIQRVAAFAGESRRPPLYWVGGNYSQGEEMGRWLRTHPAGRALKRATDDFWAEAAALLADDDRTCPAAAARFRTDRAALIRLLDAEEQRRAAKAARPGG
jgi:hypothetical protein